MQKNHSRRILNFTGEQKKAELYFFLIPILCSGAFQQLYSLINTAVISRYLSYESVAVIGACALYASLQDFLFAGMTTGFSFYIYRCIGTGEEETFRKGFWGSVYLTGGLAVLGVILAFFSPAFMLLANIPPNLRSEAKLYFFFLMAGSGALGLKNLLLCTVQGLGDTKFPGLLSMAGVFTHTALTVFLIAGLKLPVFAAALAILLNNLFLSFCLIFYLSLHCRRPCRKISPGEILPDVWMELSKSGAAKSGMMMVIWLGSLLMQRSVNGFSGEIIAATAYANTVNAFFMSIFSAYATAAGIITGQNKGKQNFANIQSYHQRLLRMSFCWCAAFGMVNLCASGTILGLLAGESITPGIIQAGTCYLRICSVGYPGLCLLLICRSSLQSMGQYKILPWLGLQEMLANMILALLAPRFGYLCVCLANVIKWSLPGLTACVCHRKYLKSQKQKC